MSGLEDIEAAANEHALAVLGALHPTDNNGCPSGTGTLVLLGPCGPSFWPFFQSSEEAHDNDVDPLDRWSVRVIGALARAFDATALFPFGGPPHLPFLRWAQHSGRAWPSPVGLMVHDTAGLWVSYRGALALPQRLAIPPAPSRPCDDCASQPCRAACPVGALGRPEGYDTDACRAHLDRPNGADCREAGCRARRACPVSQQYGRIPAQSAFHMKSFQP